MQIPMKLVTLLTIGTMLPNLACANDHLPRQLALLSLGEKPPSQYLIKTREADTSPRQFREIARIAGNSMWRSIFPSSPTPDLTTSLVLYKGRVAEINFSVNNKDFKELRKSLTKYFGKGLEADDRYPLVEGCPRYFFQRWSDEQTKLYLVAEVGEPVVTLVLRDYRLNQELTSDHSLHFESELCVEF